MSSTAATQHQDEFLALRERYIAQIEKTIPFLERCEQFLEKSRHDSAVFEKLQRLAHRMAGSGGTYGFPKISEMARAVEIAVSGSIESDEQKSELRQKLTLLLDSVSDARARLYQEHRLTTRHHPNVSPARTAPELPPVVANLPPKVLVVDDDPLICHILENTIGTQAILTIHNDGVDVIKTIEQERPSLVILDDDLPSVRGLDVLEEIRSRPDISQTRVVLLTSNDTPDAMLRAVNAAVLDYTTKPFDTHRFAEKMKSLIERSDRRVLIVDDDATVTDLLSCWFDRIGMATTCVPDGLSALSAIMEDRPNLIILDRSLPGMEGSAILQNLKNNPVWSSIPVVMLSARNEKGEVSDWIKRGAMDYIQKPFDPDDVVFRGLRAMGLKDAECNRVRTLLGL
ncbi:response regulator [Parvularcula sp. LCG005]|uniref:response regulator n=1 Tax=Parvularcula sp. LCG005 TaxID=3078805 RepID=UPI0029433DFA|nr:response regulator [Parvularcula sp. LCG005]WOI52916.1 response regulator [Parvularcula sp. LCG005]